MTFTTVTNKYCHYFDLLSALHPHQIHAPIYNWWRDPPRLFHLKWNNWNTKMAEIAHNHRLHSHLPETPPFSVPLVPLPTLTR